MVRGMPHAQSVLFNFLCLEIACETYRLQTCKETTKQFVFEKSIIVKMQIVSKKKEISASFKYCSLTTEYSVNNL